MAIMEWMRRWVRHPLAKRAGLTLAIVGCISLVRLWLGHEQSVFVGVLTGVISYTVATLILSDQATRKLYREQFKNWLAMNLAAATRTACLLVVMVFAYSTRKAPGEPFVQQVLLLVETLGLLVIVAIPAFRAVFSMGSEYALSSSIFRSVASFTGYAIALWLIGEWGDDAYRYAMADPNGAMVVIVSVVICWAILRFGAPPATTQVIAFEGTSAASVSIHRKATARDTRYIAAHEAGHALVYAALGGLPADVRLVVNEQADERGALGFVTGISNPHRLEEKSFAEWYMLVLLAGKLAEATLQGSSTLGSSNDHMRWLATARNYLASHYRGMFYLEPQNKFEQEQNEAKLEALQAEQLTLLRNLFDLNAVVFKQLADTLLEKRELGRDDLIPILGLVVLPEGFPLPFGPFARFCDEWPRGEA